MGAGASVAAYRGFETAQTPEEIASGFAPYRQMAVQGSIQSKPFWLHTGRVCWAWRHEAELLQMRIIEDPSK